MNRILPYTKIVVIRFLATLNILIDKHVHLFYKPQRLVHVLNRDLTCILEEKRSFSL